MLSSVQFFICYLYLTWKCHLFKHNHNVYMLNIQHLIKTTIAKSKAQVPPLYTSVYIIPSFCWGKTQNDNWRQLVSNLAISKTQSDFEHFFFFFKQSDLAQNLCFHSISTSSTIHSNTCFWNFLLLSHLLYSCTKSGIIHSQTSH